MFENYDEIIKMFKVKNVRIYKMENKKVPEINFNDNSMTMDLPFGACVLYGSESIPLNTVLIEYKEEKGKPFFSVSVDDLLYIGDKFQFHGNKKQQAWFGLEVAHNGGTKVFPSIHDRVAGVSAAIMKGVIALSLDFYEYVDKADYHQCQTCEEVYPLDKIEDTEHDGDLWGTCPQCSLLRIFIPSDLLGNVKEVSGVDIKKEEE